MELFHRVLTAESRNSSVVCKQHVSMTCDIHSMTCDIHSMTCSGCCVDDGGSVGKPGKVTMKHRKSSDSTPPSKSIVYLKHRILETPYLTLRNWNDWLCLYSTVPEASYLEAISRCTVYSERHFWSTLLHRTWSTVLVAIFLEHRTWSTVLEAPYLKRLIVLEAPYLTHCTRSIVLEVHFSRHRSWRIVHEAPHYTVLVAQYL